MNKRIQVVAHCNLQTCVIANDCNNENEMKLISDNQILQKQASKSDPQFILLCNDNGERIGLFEKKVGIADSDSIEVIWEKIF